MSSSSSILRQLAGILVKSFTGRSSSATRPRRPAGPARARTASEPGRAQGSDTFRIDPDAIAALRIGYAPEKDGTPDAGEVIWTWVPYEENDGRGKDRPVLVIGRASDDRAYAVRMTSKPHERDRDYLSIGSGAWDSQRRESWVDIEQLYSVHEDGMRREAAILDRTRYERVADALVRRYGWARR